MLDRRALLKSSALALASLSTRAASAQPAPPPEVERFSSQAVVGLARDLSRKAFQPLSADLPAPFNALTYEQYVGIRAKSGSALWANEGLPFLVEPSHRGGPAFAAPIAIYVVENGFVRPLAYDPAAFDFGKLAIPGTLGNLGFSGFRVLRARADGPPVDVAFFQGAASYRAVARGQAVGVVSRSLAIRTADAKGEEIPFFRATWIERPTPSADTLIVHALLDSESVTGAYRFVLRSGDVTVIDVETTLFPRVALDHVGLAPAQATSLLGPLDRRRFDDARPAVYEVSGLRMQTGAGEWLWRPVSNRENLQISQFVDENPRRFGLMQRERDFERFMDDDQHWELRPSLMVEPMGEWGAGAVQLVEIPAESENNDNIIAYWRPKAGLAQGQEFTFAYRQLWGWDTPDPPPLAVATQSRSGRVGATKKRRFIIEFAGGPLGEPTLDPRAELKATQGAISNLRTFIVRHRRKMRVVFDLEPSGDQSELRLFLSVDGRPISETWLYRWTP